MICSEEADNRRACSVTIKPGIAQNAAVARFNCKYQDLIFISAVERYGTNGSFGTAGTTGILSLNLEL
jgi:hypothetical protein